MRIVLGVSGSIAAYKVVSLLRIFRDFHHEVVVVPTQSALQFVGAPTWEALSGQPVFSDVFSDVSSVRHVTLGQQADLVVVAPATADVLARMSTGQADDLLTNTLLATQAPVVVAPAMHDEMWQHPATIENVAVLRRRGVTVIEPVVGRLTGDESGRGRLPEPEDIYAAAMAAVEDTEALLKGKKVVVTAGGTREAIDPVRFIGNYSTGKQGVRLAEAALRAGAQVRLIAAHVDVSLPRESARLTLERVASSAELKEAVFRIAADTDAIIMAAAVADFRPAHHATAKLKKNRDGSEMQLALVENPDILGELVRNSRRGMPHVALGTPIIVGFAAETGDANYSVREHAYAKLRRKGCDMLVVNDVSEGKVFGADTNSVVILDRATTKAEAVAAPEITGTKTEIASVIICELAVRMRASEKLPSS